MRYVVWAISLAAHGRAGEDFSLFPLPLCERDHFQNWYDIFDFWFKLTPRQSLRRGRQKSIPPSR